METRIGEWYLCESYIQEPVLVEALESDKILVRYLTTGRTRWLGYPRIWYACKPKPIKRDVSYDPQTQLITLTSRDGSEEPQQLGLAQLRAQLFPQAARPRLVRPRRAAQPAAGIAAGFNEPADWDKDDQVWSLDDDIDVSDDEADYALDMSL